MALSVLNNIASLAAQNQLTITNGNLQKALFQLSSGSRINTGADDAAGLAIADGLHANITALTQSARNANDGVGELQVADGSLAQVTTLLNRAVTIATESATGTVSDAQRVALDDEYVAIKAEIDRVGSKTNYNGGQVFTNGTLNVFLSDAGANSNSTIGVTTGLLSSTNLGVAGTPATATLQQTQAANATDAIATLNGGAFVGSTAATNVLTGGNLAGIQSATTTLTGGPFTQATAATGTLNSTGALPTPGDTVTIGTHTYTFRAAVGGGGATADDILIGATSTISLANLTNAINGNVADAGGSGAGGYGTATVTNAAVSAVDTTPGTQLTFTAKANGSAVVTTAKSAATLTFGGGLLTNGVAGSTVTIGATTYTFVTNFSSTITANEVKFGADLSHALGNLQDAINLTAVNGAGIGATFSTLTVINASATAGTAAPTTLGFTSKVAGVGGGQTGNTITASIGGGIGSITAFTGGAAADTVTVGAQTYTFVAALSGAANEVLVGNGGTQAANNTSTLAHLVEAINNGPAGTGVGVDYGVATAANVSAAAGAVGGAGTTVTLTAKVTGAGGGGQTGNNITSTITGSHGGFANTTFQNGTDGGTITIGAQTYKFVQALSTTATANEVLVGINETATLANLAGAVDNSAANGQAAGTTYSTGTGLNASAAATSGATTATFTAKNAGVGGNTIVSTITGGVGAFTQVGSATHFTGGVNAISAGGIAAAGDTITVGTQTYTFVAALSATPVQNQVLIGALNSDSLSNLAAAVNGASGAGTAYSSNTLANTSAAAVATPAGAPTSIVFTALQGGLGGNSIASTSTGGDDTFAGTTFTGGGASLNNLLSQSSATAALATINSAVQSVAALRGTIGATVNRLQSAATVITNQVQNLTGAEDGVRAADIPSTVATLAKYSILEQTGISSLAQANQQQQLVLKLLQ